MQAGGRVLRARRPDPLDEERTLGDLGLRDGETVHLRLRGDALPEIHYDDLVDGLSGKLRQRADSWRPVRSHHLMTGLALSALATGLLLLLLPGPSGLRALCAAATAVVLLAGAAAASRAVGDVERARRSARAGKPSPTWRWPVRWCRRALRRTRRGRPAPRGLCRRGRRRRARGGRRGRVRPAVPGHRPGRGPGGARRGRNAVRRGGRPHSRPADPDRPAGVLPAVAGVPPVRPQGAAAAHLHGPVAGGHRPHPGRVDRPPGRPPPTST
ncbi:hypothetical protein SCALM49S_03695 [Streptomyces californicus]